ncbi:MAG: FimV/HubP family polar landmark protein [Pseudomonas sp.]
MARFRHILLTLASGSALYSGMASALGLGEISLHSALNQPLDADIELLQAGELSSDEIKVRLASAEDFTRSGVDRFIFLNDLRFTPILRGGRQVIRVVSSKPVREPYLNFIVELARPGGNLLREYTLLIDPPTSAAYRQLAAPLERTAPVASRDSGAAAPAPERPRTKPAVLQGRQYQVQAGDNLWSIAGRVEDGRSRDAVMADILALNPQAFVGGDRNRLRAHARLLLPDSAAPAQAQPVATASAPAMPAPQPVDAPQQAVLAQAAVDAELASEMAQNQALKQAIGDLQSQLQQLQQQMAEKDRQLAQIHSELAQREQAVLEPQIEPVAPVIPTQPAPAVTASEPATPWAAWFGAGALCLVLIGGVWLLARRRVPQHEPEPLRQAHGAPSVAAPPPLEDDEDEPPQVAPLAAPEPVRGPVSTDALEGANIYIAYGRLSEAALALRTAIEREPQRLDLRLRLLEVLGELGDTSGFAEQERGLHELGAEPTQIEQIHARYGHLQANPVDELAATAWRQEAPLAAASELSDDFQLNLDDLSLDTDWGLDSPFKPVAPTRSKTSQPVVDAAFRSNLRELPEVFELTVDKELLSPFGESSLPVAQEIVLDEEFVDAFASEPVGHGRAPVASSLEHLAADREHLARLNMALAYIEQGDIGSACDILNEVISTGDAQEQQCARELLAKIA